ncbi:MAG: glycoside hydrolase [Siculibacillus sp.]|nr:glycoside hydrolase [Siculibacillus sp.]
MRALYREMKIIVAVGSVAVFSVAPAPRGHAAEPLVCAAACTDVGAPVAVPDRSVAFFPLERGVAGRLRRGADKGLFLDTTRDGETWETLTIVGAEAVPLSAASAIRLRDGTILLFSLAKRCAERCRRPAIDYFFDLVLTRIAPDGRVAGPTEVIRAGFVGDIRRAVELPSGRIVLPFTTWRPGAVAGPPAGPTDVVIAISDDHGASFRIITPGLVAPVPETPRAPGFGAVEPAIGLMPDGTLLMLFRTQTDALWRSTSRDGEVWTAAEPSGFFSPSAPAFLAETPEGGLIVTWNQTHQPSRHGDRMVYGGRDVLSAAHLAHGGTAWRGFRPVLTDERYAEVIDGDQGTAYPRVAPLAGGRVLLVAGQGGGRKRLVSFGLPWLLSGCQNAPSGASEPHWIGFSETGPVVRHKRARLRTVFDGAPGAPAEFVAHGSGAAAGLVGVPRLEDGLAEWRVESRLPDGGPAIEVTLLDRFVNPDDPAVERATLARFLLAGGRKAADLRLTWSTGERLATLSLDGRRVGSAAIGDRHVAFIRLGFHSAGGAAEVSGSPETVAAEPRPIARVDGPRVCAATRPTRR